MKAWTIIFCALVLVVVNSFVSCEIANPYQTPQTIYLSSESLDTYRDKDDDKDDKDDDLCSNRDSCQDICDDMFKSSKARGECYELDLDETTDLQNAFDALSSSEITERKLENVDASDLEAFLEISVDGFVDIIQGNNKEAKNGLGYSDDERKEALKWIGENSDVAEVILDQDDDLDILYSLFEMQESSNYSFTINGTTIQWFGSTLRVGSESLNLDVSSPFAIQFFAWVFRVQWL